MVIQRGGTVGLFDGDLVCGFVGAIEGAKVGHPMGVGDGDTVGECICLSVGTAERIVFGQFAKRYLPHGASSQCLLPSITLEMGRFGAAMK